MTHHKPLYTPKNALEAASNYRFASIAINAIKSIDRNLKLGITVSLAAAMYLSEFSRTANAAEPNSSIAQSWTSQSSVDNSRRSQYRYNLLPKIFTKVFSDRTNAIADRQLKPNNIIASASSPVTQQRTYQVKPGDTIHRIAKMYRVSKDELLKLNGIPNSNIIFVNQRLKIPVANDGNSIDNSERSPSMSGQSQVVRGIETTPIDSVKLAHKTSATSVQNPNQLSSAAKEDSHLSKLQADIELLRKQYEAQSTTKPKPSSSIEAAPITTHTSKTKQKELKEISVSTANVDSLSSNSEVSSKLQNAIALTLPPLPPSSEYLPSAFDGYIWPAQGVLTSGYGWRWGRLHQGIDIAAPIGTPILAAASGKVINAGWHEGYGYLIKLEHLDGSVTVYAHNYRNLVTHGQQVQQGEQIAEMGNTGNSTGSHLHFEIITKDRKIVDPMALLGSRL